MAIVCINRLCDDNNAQSLYQCDTFSSFGTFVVFFFGGFMISGKFVYMRKETKTKKNCATGKDLM